MQIIESYLTACPCYMEGAKLIVRGLMLHSVGTAQPSAEVFIKKWNKPTHTRSCVHGFIDANTGVIYNTLPWDMKAWHCGKGTNGSANNTHIGVEMCEPASIKYTGGSKFIVENLEDAQAAATRTYNAAVELFAGLARAFNIDPYEPGAIISHSEGHKLGVASNHADPEHLWRGLSLPYTMDTFRKDVAEKMKKPTPTPTPGQIIEPPAIASVIGRVVQLAKGDSLNVRTGPGTSYPNVKEYPKLESGNAFEICGTDASRKWYYINIAGAGYNTAGWVYGKYVELV